MNKLFKVLSLGLMASVVLSSMPIQAKSDSVDLAESCVRNATMGVFFLGASAAAAITDHSEAAIGFAAVGLMASANILDAHYKMHKIVVKKEGGSLSFTPYVGSVLCSIAGTGLFIEFVRRAVIKTSLR
jgi:hypothetical protein